MKKGKMKIINIQSDGVKLHISTGQENCLVDIEDLVTTLSEGKTLSEKEAVSLGEACVEAVQYFNRSEEVSKNEVIAVFSKLNNLVFKNDLFA